MAGENRGFILVEVMMAMVVLMVCLVPIMLGFTWAAEQLAGTGTRSVAAELARGKFEEIAGTGFESIVSEAKQSFPAPNNAFQYSVHVWEDEALAGCLKNITVEVYYTDPATGTEKSVTFAGARAGR